jgi:hypothetical protein
MFGHIVNGCGHLGYLACSTGCFRLLATRFIARICISEPGPQEHYSIPVEDDKAYPLF